VIAVRRAESDDDLRDVIAARYAVHPEAESTIEGYRHHLASWPGLAYFAAHAGTTPVGCGFCGPFPGTEADPFVNADFSVLAEYRRRGFGSAIARAVSEHARSLGKEGLTVEAREDTPEASDFLEKRGFVEVERQKALALELDDLELPEPAPPEGVIIVTRAERPGLERAMYEVGVEAGRDIPGLDSEHTTTFEEWRAFEIERPSRSPARTFIALAGDEVVGYAVLERYGDVGSHGLTAVKRAWRRRGIARALKLNQLHRAQQEGLTRVLTESEERNDPMRRLNESLGFRPIPGMIVYRGPLL
jgi:ribosomal protein S18 acetylase RimI-like enzyme